MALVCTVAAPVNAQILGMDDDLRGATGFAVGATWLDFRFSESVSEDNLLFQGLAPSLTISLPGITLAATRGTSEPAGLEGSTELTDLQLSFWGRWHPWESLSEGNTTLFVPIGLQTNYRDVTTTTTRDDIPTPTFEITTISVGAGVGGDQFITDNTLFRARAHPFIGVTQRSFLGGTGWSWQVDVDAELIRGNVFGDVGLVVGYALRAQQWNLGTPAFRPENDVDDFGHFGLQHTFRLGITL